MANKRQLKKYIRFTCGDIAAEILVASSMYPSIERKNVVAIVNDIASLQCESLANASFSYDKSCKDFDNKAEYNKSKAAYNRKAFTKLMSDFHANVEKIVKEMNAALPAEVRAEFKKATE